MQQIPLKACSGFDHEAWVTKIVFLDSQLYKRPMSFSTLTLNQETGNKKYKTYKNWKSTIVNYTVNAQYKTHSPITMN